MSNRFDIRQIAGRLILGAGISFAMLAALFYAVSRSGETINLSQLVDMVRNVSLSALAGYLLCQLLGTLLRSWRYQCLLDTSGDQTRPGLKDLYPITLVRNMTVDLLPARIGELVFVGLLKRINKTHASHSLSSLLFATLFDIAIILPIVLGLILFTISEKQLTLTLLTGALVLLSGLGLVLIALKTLAPWLNGKIAALAKSHQSRVLSKLAIFSGEFNLAIQATIAGGQFYRVVWLTIGLRFVKYLGLCLLFFGVVKHSHPQLADIPLSQLISVLIAGETAASLPIPTFLSLGVYESGSAGMLTLFGISAGAALLIMLAVHLCSQLIDYTLGLAGVGWLLFPPAAIKTARMAFPGRARLAMAGVFAVLCLAGFVYGWQSIKNAWSVNAPPAGQAISPDKKPKQIQGWDSGEGFVVWSSNRNGNHDIYHMTLPDRNVTRLTDHPHTENLPKISPNGRKLVFQRSRKPWQSFREHEPWDVIIKDLRSGKEKVLAKNAYEPNWTPDGKRVTFSRDYHSVYAVELTTGKEEKLYDSAGLDLPGNAVLQTPMINSLGELAVTVRGPLRMTAVYKINNPIHVGQGCQVTWSPDESFVYYIDSGGRGKNLLRKYDFKTGENTVWMDMPGKYSHEYFPKLTSDGKWMVIAASAGGHEHDTADYELFLWKVDSDPKTMTRLTHHSGNDSWPDIFIY